MGTESETVLTEYFPKKPQTGDVYFQRTMGSRLIYTYNRGGEYGAEWSVVADRDYEPKYDEIGILSKIAGKPVTSLLPHLTVTSMITEQSGLFVRSSVEITAQ